VKGAIEEALGRTGLCVSFAPLDPPGAFRPGQAASIVHEGRGVGRIGVLSGEAASRLGIRGETILAEINLGAIFAAPEDRTILRPLPRYPSAVRDLALVVKRGTRWVDIERTIREAGGGVIAKVAVFDRYEGAALEKDRFSLAVSIQYQHAERTLATDEISAAEASVLSALRERHGIILRQT
jgi:phenylalanyl-tRNA synthetase beta chain